MVHRCMLWLIAALCMSASSTVHAASIAISPSFATTNVGSSITVAIEVRGLGAGTGPSLGAFDLALRFDASILDAPIVRFGDPLRGDQLDLAGIGSLTFVDLTPPIPLRRTARLSLGEISFDSPDDLNALQADAFALATLTFGTRAPGTSPLLVTASMLSDALGNPIRTDALRGAKIRVRGRPRAPTAPVPEPSSTALLAVGLAVVYAVSRRRAPSCQRTRRD